MDINVVVMVLVLVPQCYKKLVSGSSILYNETEGWPETAFPIMTWYRRRLFVKVDGLTGPQPKYTGCEKDEECIRPLHSVKISLTLFCVRAIPCILPLHNTFNTCSFAFSSSSFIITTHFWIVES